MTNSKTTKRALLSSVLAMLLCIAMLVGTTFAWFTDSASTSVNKIQAGNLDVALEMKDAAGNWVSAENEKLSFADVNGNTDILWEPGATFKLPTLRIANNGNLALKYKVVFSAVNGGEDAMELASVLDVYLNGNYVCTLKDVLTSTDPDGFAHGNLTAGANSGELVITVKMQEGAGNDYQNLSIDGVAVTVFATQDTVEYDSNGNQYDNDAEYDAASVWDGETFDTSWYNENKSEFEICTGAEFAGLSQLSATGVNFAGKKITMTENVNLGDKNWTPIQSFKGEFDGNKKTISDFNVKVTSDNGRGGLFKVIDEGANVHDLTVSDVSATTDKGYFGTLACEIKQNTTVENVTVRDVDITVKGNNDRAGGFCVYAREDVSNCYAENITINALAGANMLSGFAAFTFNDKLNSTVAYPKCGPAYTNCGVKGLKVNIAEKNETVFGGFTAQTQAAALNVFTNCSVTDLDVKVVTGGNGTTDLVYIGSFVGNAGACVKAVNCTTSGKIDATAAVGSGSLVSGFNCDLGWGSAFNMEGAERTHEFDNCTTNVDISVSDVTAGGLLASTGVYNVSENGKNVTINDCTVNGNITATGKAFVGGCVGYADRGDYTGCTVNGTISGENSGKVVGRDMRTGN